MASFLFETLEAMKFPFILHPQASGEGNGLTSIKVIKNKYTGEPATYGFINYVSDHNALLALHRLAHINDSAFS